VIGRDFGQQLAPDAFIDQAKDAMVWAERLRTEFWRGFFWGTAAGLGVRGVLFVLQVAFR
jgi:hypothetical protein